MDIRSDRFWSTQGFLTKNIKENLWDQKFLSNATGCRKTQVSDCTGSTVFIIFVYYLETLIGWKQVTWRSMKSNITYGVVFIQFHWLNQSHDIQNIKRIFFHCEETTRLVSILKKNWRYVSIFKYIDTMLLNLDPDIVRSGPCLHSTCSKQFSSFIVLQ